MLNAMVAYHGTANGRLLDLAGQLPDHILDAPIEERSRSIRETFRHMTDTDRRWRIFVETRFPVWDDGGPVADLMSIDDLATYQANETAALCDWLERQSEAQLMEEIEVTWQGETSQITAWQSLLQLLLHAQQHRSEIAIALTRQNLSPNDIDFVMYI